MAIDHEMNRQRVKEYATNSGHDIQYHDGGAQKKNDGIVEKLEAISPVAKGLVSLAKKRNNVYKKILG